MPKLHVPPAPDEFVRPKVGDTVWYYFEHAFWDDPQPSLNLNERWRNLPPEIVKRWRFTGRTELRARSAIISGVQYDWRQLNLKPEYHSDDRVLAIFKEGPSACLAPRQVSAFIHPFLGEIKHGRIVNGVLPRAGTWGFDPLPPIGGGR